MFGGSYVVITVSVSLFVLKFFLSSIIPICSEVPRKELGLHFCCFLCFFITTSASIVLCFLHLLPRKGDMGPNVEEEVSLHSKFKDGAEEDVEQSIFASLSKSPSPTNSRPSSMVLKKAHCVIPAHLIAEAMSTLHGLDLRWSGPITPSEMQYVEQYVLAKYPQYCNGLVEDKDRFDLYNSLSLEGDNNSESPLHDKRNSPTTSANTPSFSISVSNLENTLLEPSKLVDVLTKKSSFPGNFISIPEIQAQNRALNFCGLNEEEYAVLFIPNYKDAMMMIGESYPFFRGNYYMTVIDEELDSIKDFAAYKEAKVIAAPESWLDLRIKGSQLSQYFRRKCKHVPKGLFSYPADVNGRRHSMHWISEAHRNSWHVLLDATALVVGTDRLVLALHRPDFVLCTLDNTHAQPSKITCLLVRRKSFDFSTYLS